jgi:NADH-quinone oxidoreductase subunit L
MSLEFDPTIDYALLLAVPAIPLVGYLINVFFGRRIPRNGDWLLTAGMFVSMCITLWLAAKAIASGGHDFIHESHAEGMVFPWLYSSAGAAGNVVAGILYDPLGAVMLAVVGVVSFCVHLFSIGYMHGDKRYHLFFANISLFTVAMLGLVLSDNILFLFVFWEIMGLMSYLLISHFSQDPSNPYFHRWATWASKKAFLTTRVGDVCLFLGMLWFYKEFETLRFTELWEASRLAVAENGGDFPSWMTWAGLLVFGGTMGKSAQFPLHIWLPDAMAGPTPVSAMIHAATMVAAGVFLLGRMFPLMSPEALTVITVVGATTALLAATIGMTVYDLKAVLAFSTISQLGFMVCAVGLGGVTAGMFHMVTHAFFKACLFLSAGAVIHACHHEQDMRKMGGLRKLMPVTFACMLICTLAIAGVPWFSGFYSKDMIIASAYEGLDVAFDGWKVYALVALALAATMTAFYMFRLMFMTFAGEYRGDVAPAGHGHGHDDHEDEHHHELVHAEDGGIAHGHPGPLPHEVGMTMRVPLVILAALGLLGGHFWLADSHFWKFWGAHPWFEHLASLSGMYGAEVGAWLTDLKFGDHDIAHVKHAAHSKAVMSSMVIAPVGILAAWFLYVKRKDLPARFIRVLGPLYVIPRDRYYSDLIVDRAVIAPTMWLTRAFRWIDENVVDGLVLLVGRVNRSLGFLWAWVDRRFVDGAVNGVAMVTQAFGAIARLFQTGRIQQYAAFAVAGALFTAAWLILS